MLYNPALLINDMILFGDTLLNMSVNVKLFSNKINLKKIHIQTAYQYMTDSRDQKRVFLHVDAYISQVTVDHGLQLWGIWSRSPDCDVVSVTNPLDRGSRPWHISYVIVEQ